MPEQPGRELVVMLDPAAQFRSGGTGLPDAIAAAPDIGPLAGLLADAGAAITPLFGAGADAGEVGAAAAPPVAGAPDLTMFYRVTAPDDRLDEVAARLRELDFVQAAYVKPPVQLPLWRQDTPPGPPPPALTPDFSGNQGYLDAAPGGIDARFAWSLPGGRGEGVQIIDVEGAWRFTHEDLTGNQGGVVAGTEIADLVFRDHGTAVIGVLGADDNGLGVLGICPDANVRAVSHSGLGLATALTTAANLLGAGDILVIEAHQPGPRFGFTLRPDQRGYIAVQYWPDVYAAITYAAVVRGVIVVEAAGNGAEDLDDPLYSAPQPGFPPFWSPFNRGAGDCGAILVGAGAPKDGTHGVSAYGPDRSRLDFSNFAACIDAQGWGAEVTTTGYGDLQGGAGTNEDQWYTNRFGGTSSASPVVAGALACLQGMLRAAGKPLLTPISARNLLRTLGSAQQDHPLRPATQRIGNLPDLFLMSASL